MVLAKPHVYIQYDPSLPPDRILDFTADALLLRQGLHTEFDVNMFVFVPKKGANIYIGSFRLQGCIKSQTRQMESNRHLQSCRA